MESETTLVVEKIHFSNDIASLEQPYEGKSLTKYLKNKGEKKANVKIKEEFKEYSKVQLFRKQWLKLPEFRDWLTEDLFPHKGYCTVCNVSLVAGKSELLAHSRSKRHIRNVELMKNKKEESNDILSPDVTAIVDDNGSTHLLRIIDLRSDSLSIPTREMKNAMVDFGGLDVSFNTNKATRDLEELITSTLEKEAALLFPTHVMANFVAVLAHCQSRGSAVIVGKDSDIYHNNSEAAVKFGGLHLCTLPENSDGTFCLDSLEDQIKKLSFLPPLTCVVCYECAHVRKGGVVPPLPWLDQLGAFASVYKLAIHCDGTRLINASLSKQVPLSKLVEHCDSVTMAFDKCFGAPAGAVLVGSKSFIKRAAFLRKLVGGVVHQAGYYAASALYAMNHMPDYIDADHEKARAVGIAISKGNVPALTVDLFSVQTNVLLIKCQGEYLNAPQLKERLASVNTEECDNCGGENIIVLGETVNETELLLMFHNKVSQTDVRSIIQKLNYIMTEYDVNIKP